MGWHHDYKGYIYVELGFPDKINEDSYGKEYYGRDFLRIDFGEENPFLVGKPSPTIFAVCYDLG